MRLVLFFYFISIFSGLHAQQVMSSNKKAIKLYEQGKKLIRERDFPGAIVKYNQAIQKDSAFAEAYLQAAAAYTTLNQGNMTLPYYQQLITRYPESPRYKGAYFRLAQYEFSRGGYKMALDYSEKYLSLITTTAKNYLATQSIRNNCLFALARIDHPLNFNPRPLPDPLNRFQQQYFPVLTADLNTLFFIKRDQDEEIYQSKRNTDGSWSVPHPIDASLTSEYNEGTCSVSADGHTMVFTSCMRQDGYGSCDLYITYKIGQNWTKPKNIGRPINSSAWDSQPALSADGHTLYYVSNRKGGLGKRDIWVSHYTPASGWSNPRNLGPAINTKADDISPFIHVNGKTLYFGSDGRPGFGGFDIYYAEKDSLNKWQQPINFGYPINTHNDELAMFITADGTHGYYSHETKLGDQLISKLFQINIPPEIGIKYRSSFVAGTVYDSLTKNPVAAEVSLYNLSANQPVSRVMSDSISGKYLIVLTEGAEYAVYVKAKQYLFRSYYFNLDNDSIGFEGITANIALSPLVTGGKTRLNNVFFEFDSFALTKKSQTALIFVVNYLKEHPDLNIEIAGYTDNMGSEAYNNNLSTNRASAVYKFLVEHNVNKDRLTYKGYGSLYPAATNANDFGRAKNRRIELKILK